MKKAIFIFIGAILLTACQESMDERCAREAREFTKKKCPALVANGVTVDSMTFEPKSRTLSYYYTVEGVADDPEVIQRNDLRSMMLKELKNSATLKDYKEAGYQFRYVYRSAKNKGTQLFEATFRQKDYR